MVAHIARLFVLALLSLSTVLVVMPAAPVAAQTVCAPGSREVPGLGKCVNVNGVRTGGVPAAPDNVAPVRYPSSVLAAANGVGGTATQNANLAGLNGQSDKITLAGRLNKVDAATSVVAAGLIGYEIGQGIAKLSCFAGLDATCVAPAAPNFEPNLDAVIGGDPGWINGTGTVTSDGVPVDLGFTQEYVAGTAVPNNEVLVKLTPWTGDTGGGRTIFGGSYPLNEPAACTQGTAAFGDRSYNAVMGIPVCQQLAQAPSYVVPKMTLFCTPAAVACDLAALANKVPGVTAYRFKGDPERPAAQPGNPQRVYESERGCSGGSTRKADSAPFRETDPDWPAFVEPALCPTGEETTSITVRSKSPGLAPKKVYEVAVPDPVKVWGNTYPECGGGVCRLGVWKVTPNGTRSCFDRSTDCEGWFRDPAKEDTYRCTYGRGAASTFASSQVVALAECKVYAPTFNPQDVAQTKVYADPETGATPQIDAPAPDAATDPQAPPGVESNDPSVDGGDNGVCFPQGWGALNPLEWVYKPVKCALVWAFVPSPGSWDVAGLKAQAAARPPWSLIAGGAAGISSIASAYAANGCGVLVSLGGNDLSTCTLDSVPGYSALYGLAQVALLGFTGLGMFKMVAGAVSGRGGE